MLTLHSNGSSVHMGTSYALLSMHKIRAFHINVELKNAEKKVKCAVIRCDLVNHYECVFSLFGGGKKNWEQGEWLATFCSRWKQLLIIISLYGFLNWLKVLCIKNTLSATFSSPFSYFADFFGNYLLDIRHLPNQPIL